MMDYHINIFFSEENNGYIADIPDLPGCSAFGESAEAALNELKIVKAAWLETAVEENVPIPVPKYRPVIYHIQC